MKHSNGIWPEVDVGDLLLQKNDPKLHRKLRISIVPGEEELYRQDLGCNHADLYVFETTPRDLRGLAKHYADLLTPEERGVLSHCLSKGYLLFQCLDQWLAKEKFEATWAQATLTAEFLNIVEDDWKLPRPQPLRFGESMENTRYFPFDQAKGIDIDINITGEEKELVWKHQDVCRYMGVEEEILAPYFEEYERPQKKHRVK